MSNRIEVTRTYKGPRSICTCGHAGDGQGLADGGGSHVVSLHAGTIGHGACMHGKCKCAKFTWAGYTEAFERALSTASDAPQVPT